MATNNAGGRPAMLGHSAHFDTDLDLAAQREVAIGRGSPDSTRRLTPARAGEPRIYWPTRLPLSTSVTGAVNNGTVAYWSTCSLIHQISLP